MTEEFLVFADADAVAGAIADRLVERIADLQSDSGRSVQLSLTGGRIANAAYQRLAGVGERSGVDWSRVDLWWGDERFVPADSDERNDKAALAELRPALPLEEARIHRMPADDGGIDLDQAAATYAEELGDVRFDICLLGVGSNGHVASVFPDHPSFEESLSGSAPVISVRDSPKPPPLRISLTHPVLNRSTEIWFTVTGAEKADAVGWAVHGDKPVPAGRARGADRTVWLLDTAAASRLSRESVQRVD